jgi:hypothetical protein
MISKYRESVSSTSSGASAFRRFREIGQIREHDGHGPAPSAEFGIVAVFNDLPNQLLRNITAKAAQCCLGRRHCLRQRGNLGKIGFDLARCVELQAANLGGFVD